MYKTIKIYVCLLSMLSLLAGCALTPATSTADLAVMYEKAVMDAKVAEPHEISKDLVAIVPSNTQLIWKQKPDRDAVLVVTWTSWDGYADYVGQEISLSRHVWVTVAPDVKQFCRSIKRKRTDITLRLEQLLGVPPANGKTMFVEMWVKPADLFRPSPDPGITDHEAELDFPVSSPFITVDEEYIRWFKELQEKSYRENGYPWTRLGYTYDWGNPDHEIGLSEFVIRKGAKIEVHSVSNTLEYCNTR